jgi:uroporphyrin-III C-methyltransferase
VSRGAPSLVLYMARKFAGEIADALLAAGRTASEPAAIVSNAARSDQQVIVTTLGALAAAAEKAPALSIIVIGQNVALAKELSWLAKTAL